MEGWENVVGKWSVGIWLLYPSITSCSTPLHDFQKLLVSHNDSHFENETFFTMQREFLARKGILVKEEKWRRKRREIEKKKKEAFSSKKKKGKKKVQ